MELSSEPTHARIFVHYTALLSAVVLRGVSPAYTIEAVQLIISVIASREALSQ